MKIRRRRTRQFNRNFGREVINSNIPKDSVFRNAIFWKRVARMGSHFCVTWPDHIFGEVHMKWYDKMQFVVHILLYIYCILYQLENDLSLIQSTSLFIRYGGRSLLIFDLVCGVAFLCADLLGGQLLWRVILNLHAFDEKVKLLGHPLDHRNSNRFVNSYASVGLIVLIALLVAYLIRFDNIPDPMDRFVFIVSYCLYYFSYLSTMNTYFFLLMGCFIRFGKLNSIFKLSFGIDGVKSNIRIVTMSHPSSRSLVTDLAVLHDCLLDSIELINQLFSIQAMLHTALTIAYVNVSIFTLYFAFRKYRDKVVTLSLICVSWSCLFLASVLLLIGAGSLTYSEGTNTAHIVHSILNNHSNSPYFTEKLEIFSQQLSHRSPIVSCGLFPFDWTLLFSIVGASASYLIILIQFDNTPQNNFATNNATNQTA